MSQRYRMSCAIADLLGCRPGTEESRKHLGDLEQILAETQNSPPFGNADGSVDEMFWTATRAFACSYHEMLVCLAAFP